MAPCGRDAEGPGGWDAPRRYHVGITRTRVALLAGAVAVGVFLAVLKKLAMPQGLSFGGILVAAAAFGALLGLVISLARKRGQLRKGPDE